MNITTAILIGVLASLATSLLMEVINMLNERAKATKNNARAFDETANAIKKAAEQARPAEYEYKRQTLSAEDLIKIQNENIYWLWKSGVSIRKICSLTGAAYSSVYRLIQEFKKGDKPAYDAPPEPTEYKPIKRGYGYNVQGGTLPEYGKLVRGRAAARRGSERGLGHGEILRLGLRKEIKDALIKVAQNLVQKGDQRYLLTFLWAVKNSKFYYPQTAQFNDYCDWWGRVLGVKIKHIGSMAARVAENSNTDVAFVKRNYAHYDKYFEDLENYYKGEIYDRD